MIFELYTEIKNQNSAPTSVQIHAAQGKSSQVIIQYLQELEEKFKQEKAKSHTVSRLYLTYNII